MNPWRWYSSGSASSWSQLGADDPIPGVRLYNDSTNDLIGPNAGGFGMITVVNGETPGTFEVTLQNTSDQTVYPSVLNPVLVF